MDLRRLRYALLAAGAATLLAVAPGGSASVRAGAVTAAADPITGSWLFTSRRSSLNATPATTIRASAGGFDVIVQAALEAGAPQGVTFSVLERASVYNDYPTCTYPAGTVVAHLVFKSTDANGIRRYEGSVLTAHQPSNCESLGLQGHYYAHLVRWSDSSQSPPLADGPYNRLCIDEDPGDVCYVAFDRKGGTAVPGTGGSTTTTAKPSGKPPASGRVPRNPKIPADARFKSDHTPPTVRAVASSGTRGAPFTLDYYSQDDRGFAGELYRIYRGTRLIKSWGVLAGERDGRLQRAPATLPASVSGSLTFCVGAQDLNGNRSNWSCAPLTIS